MIEKVETLIKLENATKVFYTDEVETHALSGVQLDINKGEYVAIAGPSGCGKSTLLSIIGLLNSPTDGAYILNGRPVQGSDFPKERAFVTRRSGSSSRVPISLVTSASMKMSNCR